jgi:hypothetical protein
MILFIHPKTELLLRENLPMSLPAVISRLDMPVRGRFHDEWTRADVKAARAIVMDVHWYLSLKSAIRLSHELKAISPACPIIIGGISASLFSRQLLRDSRIDYIVTGDGEIPLKRLLDALLGGASLDAVPNLVSRDGVASSTYALSATDMDRSNYRDISFFPRLQERVLRYHRMYTTPVTLPTFPYLVVFRGCPLECPACCGAPEMQRRLFHRGPVRRSAEKVQEDLAFWSRDPRLRFVNVFHDFLTTAPPAYSERVLSESYDLFVSYDLFDLPTEEQLNLLLGAFRGGKLHFSLAQKHSATRQPLDTAGLIARIKQAQSSSRRYEAVLTYVKRYLADERYATAFRSVLAATNVSPCQIDYWWEDFPVPDPAGVAGEESYRQCLSWSRKYFFMNAVFRSGVQVYRVAPTLAKSVSHWYFSRVS